MKIAALSAWTWTAGKGSWADPYAPSPDPASLEMIEAAAGAGWRGIATMIDEHGLRCIAAASGQVAVVTIRGLTMEEALHVAAGVRVLPQWDIANLTDLVQQACAGDGVVSVH